MRRLLLFALLFTAACKDDPIAPRHLDCDAILQSYQTLTGDPVFATQSVRYLDARIGNGAVADLGRTVEVNYTLYIQSEGTTPIDTSCPEARATLPFTIGSGELLAGFEIGVVGMREGGIRRVILAPDAAYTDPTHPLFNEELTFDIELIEIR